MTIEIGFLLALVGGFIGPAGWLGGRGKKTAEDAEWRGQVNAKLDVIVGLRSDVDNIASKLDQHSERIAKVEASAASLHKRLDEIRKG